MLLRYVGLIPKVKSPVFGKIEFGEEREVEDSLAKELVATSNWVPAVKVEQAAASTKRKKSETKGGEL